MGYQAKVKRSRSYVTTRQSNRQPPKRDERVYRRVLEKLRVRSGRTQSTPHLVDDM